MSGRPVDWSPLADRDPIGGDVAAVASEANYYSSLAQEISDQVARLRKIASEGEQIGKTADKLREAAGDTAGKLQQTHGRVAAVGSALTKWIPHLEVAQADTLSALQAAQNAQADQAANQPPSGPAPQHPTDAEKAADTARQNRLSAANDAMSAARTKFDNAVSERDTQASAIARQIKDALHDGLKDSWWDSFCHWVSQHVAIIKMVVDVLSWVATGLAILSIFFPVLLPFAIAFTALTMLGHTLLAATGNGSWADVALDAFALATMGAGSMLSGMARAGRLAAVAESGELDGAAARTLVETSRAGEKSVLEAATSNVFKRFLTVRGWRAASALKGFDETTAMLADQAESAARVKALARPVAEVSPLDTLLSADKEIAENYKDVQLLAKEYPDSSVIAGAANSVAALRNANRIGVGVASGVDLTNHMLTKSDIPVPPFNLIHGVQGWESFKDQFVTGGVG